MPYFYISRGEGHTDLPECPPQPDLTPIETAILERGGMVNKVGTEITVTELIAAISTIPEGGSEGGNYGPNARIITQSEYDVLTDSEKNDGTFYFIKE